MEVTGESVEFGGAGRSGTENLPRTFPKLTTAGKIRSKVPALALNGFLESRAANQPQWQ